MKKNAKGKFNLSDPPDFLYWDPFIVSEGGDVADPENESLLIDWLDIYSAPIIQAFREKVNKYVRNISDHLDHLVGLYYPLRLDDEKEVHESKDEYIIPIKNNILHSLFASLSCLSQGLFLQSGIILRSIIEDSLVLVDLLQNEEQLSKLSKGKYSTKGLITRVKKYTPKCVIDWYGYFSANFVHFGPLHPAPYLPRACYPDNWILVTGLQNIVRAVVTLHIVLERIYYNQTIEHVFWYSHDHGPELEFNENSPVFKWARDLGEELVAEFPPDEQKEGFIRHQKSFKTK